MPATPGVRFGQNYALARSGWFWPVSALRGSAGEHSSPLTRYGRKSLRVVRHLPHVAELTESGAAGRAGVGQASREETARGTGGV